MASDRGPRRYTLQGPCNSWALQGRDGAWVRVCVPCDTVIPAGGTLPAHMGHGIPGVGYRLQGDAEMSARDHMRQMERNRRGWAARLAREAALVQACRDGDFEEFGRLIMGEAQWAARWPHDDEDPAEIMADYLRRTGH